MLARRSDGMPAPTEQKQLRLTAKQDAFYTLVIDEKVPNAGYIGGLGSAKTVCGTALVLSLLQAYPGIRGLLVAPTFDQLKQGSLQTFMEWCPQNYILSHNRTEHIIQFNFLDDEGNPSELLYRSTSDIDRIRSHEYAFCWWDESAMSPEDARQVIRGRLRHRRGLPLRSDGRADWHYPIFDTTTPRGRNHLYRAFSPDTMPGESAAMHDSRRSRFKMVHATTYDNQENLPVGYIEEQEAALLGDEQLRQQEIEGLFVTFEGLVYPQFSPDAHVRPVDAPDPTPYTSPEVVKRVAGVDFGGGDPTAIVSLGQGKSGKVHQYAEKVWPGGQNPGDTGIGEVLHEWNKKAPFDAIWCDPSNQTSIATLRSAGLPAGPLVSARGSGGQGLTARAINDRAVGIRLVGDLLSRRQLTFNPGCAQSISEFYSYLYKSAVDGEGNQYRTSTPIQHHADAMDARRYAVMGLFTNKGLSLHGRGIKARRRKVRRRARRIAA